jgi:hypothetical protein
MELENSSGLLLRNAFSGSRGLTRRATQHRAAPEEAVSINKGTLNDSLAHWRRHAPFPANNERRCCADIADARTNYQFASRRHHPLE